MPYFLVPIEGDAARAAGLLAVAGVQNLVHADPEHGLVTIARLVADDAQGAVERVNAALGGEAFTVGEPELEQ